MAKKSTSIMLFAGILALWLCVLVPPARGVTVTPLNHILESKQTALWDAAGGLGLDGTGGHGEIYQRQSDSGGASGNFQAQDFSLPDALGDVVLYGETWAIFDLLWPRGVCARAHTYAVENWSWFSMSGQSLSDVYGEYQITSETPWQIDVQFSGEKCAGSGLCMNASIYDSGWNLVQNLGRSFSWEDEWLGPEYDSAVFASGTYYLTLDVETQTHVSVSGPPEEGQEPKRVESFAQGQIIADVKAVGEAPPNQPPDIPQNLIQLMPVYSVNGYPSDGYTEIPVGGATYEHTVVFKGKVTDADGDNVKLQIELRRLDEYEGKFLNEFTQESEFTANGTVATAAAYGLVCGNYHWQARTIDENGLESEWVQFGNNDISDTDFTVGEAPSEPFTFVHITDIHIGACGPLKEFVCGADVACALLWDARDNFVETIHEINRCNPKPDFVLVTGDIVQYAEYMDKYFKVSDPGLYMDYIELLRDNLDPDIKVYEVPGNHDRYRVQQCIAYISQDLQLYHQYIKQKRPGECKDLIAGSDDYFFEHKGFLFVGLDSGEDVVTPWDLHGNGLSPEQVLALRDPEIVEPSKPKVIFMHHPAVGQADATIRKAEDFVKYCADVSNNVQLVLSGHTHEDHVFDISDERTSPTGCYGRAYPLFIQTPSATLDSDSFLYGYRIIQVKDGLACPMPYIPTRRVSKLVALTGSPVNLHIYDSQGRHTGINESSGVDQDILDSFYFARRTVTDNGRTIESLPEKIVIFDPYDNYMYQVVGTDTKTYELAIGLVQDGDTSLVFEATAIPTSAGAVHEYTIDWDALSTGEEGVVLKVDSEGDGTFEQRITAGEILENPQISVNNLVNTSTGRAAYDRRTGQFSVDVKVTNNSQTVISSPVWLVIESISNPGVTLANPDGTTVDGKPYIDLSGLLGNGQLDPGETISKRIYFNNPNRVQFTFTPSVRGVILL